MGDFTSAQRTMILASEPDDVTGEEGVGVELLTGPQYSTAKALERRGYGHVQGPGGPYPGMYWNNSTGLIARQVIQNAGTPETPEQPTVPEGAVGIKVYGGPTAYVDSCDAHLAERGWYTQVHPRNNTTYVRDAKGGYLHRIVLGLRRGDPMVDHIDGNGLNCQRANLRLSDHQSNGRNISRCDKTNKTGFLGVQKEPSGRYLARIKVNGRGIRLKTHPTAEAANVARLRAEKELWGIHPRRQAAYDAAMQYAKDNNL